jgi:hypothetical protein
MVPAVEIHFSTFSWDFQIKGSKECQAVYALDHESMKGNGLHRRKHGLDMTSEAVRRLELMHLFGGDLALEQPRPLPPKVKLIGALLPLPAKPLPQELQVSYCSQEVMPC